MSITVNTNGWSGIAHTSQAQLHKLHPASPVHARQGLHLVQSFSSAHSAVLAATLGSAEQIISAHQAKCHTMMLYMILYMQGLHQHPYPSSAQRLQDVPLLQMFHPARCPPQCVWLSRRCGNVTLSQSFWTAS